MNIQKETSLHTAMIVVVNVEYYHGRCGTIHELYVPDLNCSFNNSATFGGKKGNMIKGSKRGKIIREVKLNEIDFEKLKAWKKTEEALEMAKKEAVCCFDCFNEAIENQENVPTLSDTDRQKVYAIMTEFFSCCDLGKWNVSNIYTRLFLKPYAVKIQSVIRLYLARLLYSRKKSK